MNRKTLFAIGLGLIVSLSLGSCKDNDLADGGANGNGNTERNDALAQKYQALETLLGSLANVDSLPSNWNSDDYTVTPTVGVLKDDAQPHIRYVPTTSQAEADRIYRSYLSKDVSATPTDDSWQMDGIGSMQFHLENEPNHYATLKVNVQQLPALEEIRFVNEDYMGNNGWLAPKGCYYSFGDVVMQNVVGADQTKNAHTPTLWVCVRPCSNNPNRRQSHWCSFQLVPAGLGNESNYLEVGTKSPKSYLPTKLAFNKSDAERMVQNFFNVLRIMAVPDVARSESYAGIDDILASNDQASYFTLRATSFMWDYLNMWTKNFKLTDGTTVKLYKDNNKPNKKSLLTLLSSTTDQNVGINAYYNGYTKNIFAKGDYTVYDLYLTTKGKDPFLNVKKQTSYVSLSELFDFRQLEYGIQPEDNFTLHSDPATNKSAYQVIVKYRTGAELEGYGHSTIDVDPSKSFEERPNNHITDLLVSNSWLKKEAYTTYKDKDGETQTLLPFFSIGDRVYSRMVNGQELQNYFNFCVRNAYDNFQNIDNSWKTHALFLGYGGTTDMQVQPTEKDIAAGLYRMLKAALIFSDEAHQYLGEDYDFYTQFEQKKEEKTNDPQSRLSYLETLNVLYQVTTKMKTFASFKVDRNSNNRVGRLTARIGSTYYTLELTRTGQGKGNIHDSYRLIQEEDNAGLNLRPLQFYTYPDQYGMREDYSYTRTLVAKSKEDRDFLKTALANDLKQFIENCQ